MATNPLQKYFRQPKIFIKLPSAGVYCQPGNIQGDSNHMPVYGMTGMDEIIMIHFQLIEIRKFNFFLVHFH